MHLVSLGDSFSCGEGVGLRIDLPQTWVGLLAVVEALLDTGAAVLLVRLHDPGVMLPVPRQVTGPLRRGLAVRVGVLQATVDSLADRPGVHVLDLADVPGLGRPAPARRRRRGQSPVVTASRSDRPSSSCGLSPWGTGPCASRPWAGSHSAVAA